MGNASAPLPSQSLSARLGQWIDWRHAVALSAATVLTPVAGEFDRQADEELVGQVAVTGEVTAA